jgi:tRNA threonylcarbamoyladenosine biosynthesis protein TsaB
MKILSIDTASDLCTVAVLEDENCIKEIIVNDARNHSEKIMPVIEQALQETNLKLKDIDLFVCDKGPGSFTGIRIGVGTILAFQDSLNIPCVGISSLEALAYNVNSDSFICSLIDAKNNNVYFGLFKLENNEYSQINDLDFKNIDEVISILKQYTSPITFVGDGAIFYKNLLKSNFPNCLFVEKNELSSYSLGIAGFETYKKGIQTSLMPLYLRKSQAERALEEKMS